MRPVAAVQAATAAGMRVVTVPSLPKSEYPGPDGDASAGGPQTLPSPSPLRPALQSGSGHAMHMRATDALATLLC